MFVEMFKYTKQCFRWVLSFNEEHEGSIKAKFVD